jgi:cbb3-type cytochrome oxidase subunit 3
MLRGVMTAVLLVTFALLFLWVYSGKRQAGFAAAARLPLEED